jgi:hypothetical protein
MIEAMAKRLAALPSRELRQVTSEMAWIYRRQRVGMSVAIPPNLLTHIGEELPSATDWAAVRKMVIAIRTKVRLEANAEKAARVRIQRQRYMRVYMKDYRQKRALAALKGVST